MDPSSCLICSFSGPGLHRFPRDKKRLKDWLVAIERTDLLEIEHGCSIVYNSGRVCNAHFSDSCFCGKDKKKLAKSAVPSAIKKKTTTKKKCSTAGRNTPARYCKKLANNAAPSFFSAEEKASAAKTKYDSENTQECNTTQGDNNDISEKRLKDWLVAIERTDLLEIEHGCSIVYNSGRVCNAHFSDSCFCGKDKKKLAKSAVPSAIKKKTTTKKKCSTAGRNTPARYCKKLANNAAPSFFSAEEKASAAKTKYDSENTQECNTTQGDNNDISEKSSYVNTEKESSDNIEKEALVNIEKESPDNNEKEPSVNIEKDSSDNIEKEFSVNMEKESSDNIENEPSDNIEKEPQDNTEMEPSVNIEKESSDNTEKESSDNIEKESSDNIEKESSDNIGKKSRDNIEKEPLVNIEKESSVNKEKKSSDNIENESSVNIEKESSSVNTVHPSIQKEYGDGILNNQPATCEKRKLTDLNLTCPMGKILEENIANVVSGKREPEKIIGATKATGELLFLVKWKGVNEADLMPSAFVRKEFSKLLIQFYEERLEWAPPPSDMTEEWFA